MSDFFDESEDLYISSEGLERDSSTSEQANTWIDYGQEREEEEDEAVRAKKHKLVDSFFNHDDSSSSSSSSNVATTSSPHVPPRDPLEYAIPVHHRLTLEH